MERLQAHNLELAVRLTMAESMLTPPAAVQKKMEEQDEQISDLTGRLAIAVEALSVVSPAVSEQEKVVVVVEHERVEELEQDKATLLLRVAALQGLESALRTQLTTLAVSEASLGASLRASEEERAALAKRVGVLDTCDEDSQDISAASTPPVPERSHVGSQVGSQVGSRLIAAQSNGSNATTNGSNHGWTTEGSRSTNAPTQRAPSPSERAPSPELFELGPELEPLSPREQLEPFGRNARELAPFMSQMSQPLTLNPKP